MSTIIEQQNKQKNKNANIHTEYIIILCTIPTMPDKESVAISIAKTLIINKLAACVTLLPDVYSIYSWNKNLQQTKETQLLIKTHKKLEQAIFQYIKNKHINQTPELLTLKINNGELNYLSWIYQTLQLT